MKKFVIGFTVLSVLLFSACTDSVGKTKISASEAKEIALSNAGLTKEEVKFRRTEKDRDDGRVVYEIEFFANGNEYDYEIDANTGDIIGYDMEKADFPLAD